jgi:S-adenosylmethionine:tRNA ribosyltransferase-isomerase
MNIESNVASISMEQFNYELPDARIAKYPLELRDASKLLQWKAGTISDHTFTDLPNLLPSNSLLVFNNTKVIRARLYFRKETGALIEIFVLDPHTPADYALNFQQTEQCSWNCIVGNLKKWKSGVLKTNVHIGDTVLEMSAENLAESGGGRLIRFGWNNANYTFAEVLEAAGRMPIPPYLNRDTETSDETRYQTVYSKVKGSVAAPTAGLHFTPRVFTALDRTGMKTAELTLHVGAGTFQPVKSATIDAHEMHTEHLIVDRSFIEKLVAHAGPVIAVGTTSIRTLESLFWLGNQLKNGVGFGAETPKVNQWEPYRTSQVYSRHEAFDALLNYMKTNDLMQVQADTQIIIVPGYPFQVIDGMVTNFHQPQSTLLLLISAFLGTDWKRVYDHALESGYRFLSYGDSNLYLR